MKRTVGSALLRAVVGVMLSGIVGCSTRVADLTAASSKNLNPNGASVSGASLGQREGFSCRWNILGIPLGFPNLEEAMDSAMDPVDGNIMTNVVVYQEPHFYLLFGQACYRVKGEVFRTGSRPPSP